MSSSTASTFIADSTVAALTTTTTKALDFAHPSTYPDWMWATIIVGSIVLVMSLLCCFYLCIMPYVTCCRCCTRLMNLLCMPFQCFFKCCRKRRAARKQKKNAKAAKGAAKQAKDELEELKKVKAEIAKMQGRV